MNIKNAKGALTAIRGAIAQIEASGYKPSDPVHKSLVTAEELSSARHDGLVKDLLSNAAAAIPTNDGTEPQAGNYEGPRRYTNEEFAALPGDRGFATIRDMAIHNAKLDAGLLHPHASKVRLPYREPRFRLGDVVRCLSYGDHHPHPVVNVCWQDNTGFSASSFWRIGIQGVSGDEISFHLVSEDPPTSPS